MTPWSAAYQASLSITNSQSLLKLMSIESVMPSNHLILCPPLLLLPSIFPSIRVFSNESALRMRWPKLGVSASTSVLPMNTQDWSPLGLTSLILEKEMATNSSTLAGKSHGQRSLVGYSPWGREESVGHDWATSLSLFTFMHWRRKWQPTPVFLPGESQGQRSLVGCGLWGHTELDTTKVT